MPRYFIVKEFQFEAARYVPAQSAWGHEEHVLACMAIRSRWK